MKEKPWTLALQQKQKTSSARFKHRYFHHLIDSIDQPQGVHKIKTILFSICLPKLHELQPLSLESTNYDCEPSEFRVAAIILDTAQCRFFRPVSSVTAVDLAP